jgi:hypothetical protein
MAESSTSTEPIVAVCVVGCRERVTRLATRNPGQHRLGWVRFARCSHGGSAGRSGAGGASKCMRRGANDGDSIRSVEGWRGAGRGLEGLVPRWPKQKQQRGTLGSGQRVVCAQQPQGQQPHACRGQVTVYQHSKAQRGTAANVVVVVVVGGGERMGSPIERESTWVMTRHDDSVRCCGQKRKAPIFEF